MEVPWASHSSRSIRSYLGTPGEQSPHDITVEEKTWDLLERRAKFTVTFRSQDMKRWRLSLQGLLGWPSTDQASRRCPHRQSCRHASRVGPTSSKLLSLPSLFWSVSREHWTKLANGNFCIPGSAEPRGMTVPITTLKAPLKWGPVAAFSSGLGTAVA